MSGGRGDKGTVDSRGGYPAGPKLVTELAPPPKGPAPGAKPKSPEAPAGDEGDGRAGRPPTP